jgi:predicted nucleotidyltransferase
MKYDNMTVSFQLSNTDTLVLKFLIKNITKEFSIKMISEGVGKSYPTVWESVVKLKGDGIINVREINATQSLCSLDLKSDGNISIFSFVEYIAKREFFSKKTELKSITDDMLKRVSGNSFTLLLFGSQIKGSESEDSDIDVLVLVPTISERRRFESAVNGAQMLTNRKIDATFMAYDDFFKSLKTGDSNLSKEVFGGHVIVYGAEAFYRSLVKHG